MASGVFYYILVSTVLTPRRRSSSRPSDDNHDKAEAAEPLRQRQRLVRRVGSFSGLTVVFFHLHNSHLVAQRCGHEVEQGASSHTHFLNHMVEAADATSRLWLFAALVSWHQEYGPRARPRCRQK